MRIFIIIIFYIPWSLIYPTRVYPYEIANVTTTALAYGLFVPIYNIRAIVVVFRKKKKKTK